MAANQIQVAFNCDLRNALKSPLTAPTLAMIIDP